MWSEIFQLIELMDPNKMQMMFKVFGLLFCFRSESFFWWLMRSFNTYLIVDLFRKMFALKIEKFYAWDYCRNVVALF